MHDIVHVGVCMHDIVHVGVCMHDIVHVGALHGMCTVGARITLMAHNATVDKAASLCFGMDQLVTKVN